VAKVKGRARAARVVAKERVVILLASARNDENLVEHTHIHTHRTPIQFTGRRERPYSTSHSKVPFKSHSTSFRCMMLY
jgi:hypothetical protein